MISNDFIPLIGYDDEEDDPLTPELLLFLTCGGCD